MMKRNAILKSTLSTAALGIALVATPDAQALVTAFSDDFSGTLSGWDLTRLNAPGETANTATIVGGELVYDANAGTTEINNRGWLMTNVVVGDSATLAAAAGAGNVAMRITYDAVATPGAGRAAGGMVIGAPVYTSDLQDVGGTLLFDGTAENSSTSGANNTFLRWVAGKPYYSNGSANLTNVGPTWNTGTNHVPKEITIEWIANGSGTEVDRILFYLDGALEATIISPNVQFQSGQVGYYVAGNLDRDLTLDNFSVEVSTLIPEPASVGLLGLGGLLALTRRRHA